MIRSSRSGAGTAPRRRGRAAAAAAAGLVALGLAGCRTVTNRDQPYQITVQTSEGSPENPLATKTDFTREMKPEQKFNVYLDLGKVYEGQGQFEAAVAEYQKAAEIGEKKGGILGAGAIGPERRALAERRLGGAHDRMGRFTQAEIHYRKALELAPKDAKVWNDVGYSYYLQNRFLDAENAYKTADSLDPNNPKILTNLGLALAASGKEEEALRALSRAGGPAVGHANLGFILAAMGKAAEARSHYESALALQPQLVAAREAIARLDATATTPDPASPDGAALAAAPAPPSPSTPAASGRDAAKSDPLTRAATTGAPPRAPRPDPKPAPSPPAPPSPRAPAPGYTILGNLPQLPPMLAADPAVGRASATIEPPAKMVDGRPRRDPALHKAAAAPLKAPAHDAPRKDDKVTRATPAPKPANPVPPTP